MSSHWFSWAGSLGLLLLVDCVAEGTCLDYGCISQARLHGEVQVPASVKVIEAEYCAADACEHAELDATSTTSSTSACSASEVGVCMRGEGETRTVSAVWQGGPSPKNKLYSIRLTDHDTGQVLLEETRSLTGHFGPQQDDCHDDCWGAQAEW